MTERFDILANPQFWSAVLRIATPHDPYRKASVKLASPPQEVSPCWTC